MEDVRLGRATAVVQHPVVHRGSSDRIIDDDPDRTLLVVPASSVATITLSLSDPAVLNAGFTTGPGMPPITLNIKEHGQLVTKAWYAITDVPFTGVWFEGRLDKR